MPQGIITKSIGGFYYVFSEGKWWECRARGIFRKNKITPLVGDKVRFEPLNDQQATVDEILPRQNELIRPPIANVDQAILIFSLAEPNFSPLLLDKFLTHTEEMGIRSIICLTKADLPYNQQLIHSYIEYYRSIGYSVILVSAKTREGLADMRHQLVGRTSVFAGQSGVGKSSLLNAIIPNLLLDTGSVSTKLGRGRHTTRHVELIPVPGGGQVADTPGFSHLDFQSIEPEELANAFVEFKELAAKCRFRSCFHLKEPGCAVRTEVEIGSVARYRYKHYISFMEEIQNRKRRY